MKGCVNSWLIWGQRSLMAWTVDQGICNFHAKPGSLDHEGRQAGCKTMPQAQECVFFVTVEIRICSFGGRKSSVSISSTRNFYSVIEIRSLMGLIPSTLPFFLKKVTIPEETPSAPPYLRILCGWKQGRCSQATKLPRGHWQIQLHLQILLAQKIEENTLPA